MFWCSVSIILNGIYAFQFQCLNSTSSRHISKDVIFGQMGPFNFSQLRMMTNTLILNTINSGNGAWRAIYWASRHFCVCRYLKVLHLTFKKGFKSNFSCSVLLLKSQMSVGYSVLNSQIETTLPIQVKIPFSVPSEIMHKNKDCYSVPF